jgi:chemotaxis protein CheD
MSSKDQTASPAKMRVGLADLAVSQDPTVLLCTSPLGACLGIAIYDPTVKAGGLLHCLLPDSTLDPRRAAAQPGLFLDTGMKALLERAGKLKATRENMRVFVAGAAQIMDEMTLLNIGRFNSDFLAQLLSRLGLNVCGESLGGRTSCSMELAVGTGKVQLRFCGQAAPKTLCKP